MICAYSPEPFKQLFKLLNIFLFFLDDKSVLTARKSDQRRAVGLYLEIGNTDTASPAIHGDACLRFSNTHSSSLLFALRALADYRAFGIPESNAVVDIKAFNVASFTLNNLTRVFLSPVLPGRESLKLPITAFLVEHKPSKKKFMFDLGMRKDPENLSPAFAQLFSSKAITFEPFKDITELLTDAKIPLESIETVVWSHGHFDHIGDMSKWPKGRNIVVSSQTDLSIFPDNQNSDLQASDLDGHKVVKIDLASSNLTIGGMKAVDKFGDGSFYLLDAPGHLAGHMIALARVTPTTFIILGGDTLHHVGALRPGGAFQITVPCPGELLESAAGKISTDFFWSSGSLPGKFDITTRTQPLLALSDVDGSFFVDPPAGTVSVAKLAAMDADADFLTLVTHDGSISAALPLFPASLSDWKKEGLKEKLAWLFVDPENPAFLFSPVSHGSGAFEVAHVVAVGHYLFETTVIQFSHPEIGLVNVPTSMLVSFFVNGIITCMIEVFFGLRIYRVSNGRYKLVAIVIWVLAVAQLVIPLVPVFTGSSETIPLVAFLTEQTWAVYSAMALSALCDLLIVVGLVYFLWNERDHAHKRTVVIVDKLIAWTVETGLVTGTAATLELILFAVNAFDCEHFSLDAAKYLKASQGDGSLLTVFLLVCTQTHYSQISTLALLYALSAAV
ncbi:Metallo-beta-lactamase superfamily protein [Mycena kentingensis (nom. inval.)]|nr:Metallo-beta-lactamase superfamily protein [Mycena kentingensis (nom. inval.)]